MNVIGEQQIKPAAEIVLRYYNPILTIRRLESSHSKNSASKGIVLYTNLHNLLTLLTRSDHNPKLTLVFSAHQNILYSVVKIQWTASLLNQIVSYFPAWQRQRRRQRARPPRRCRPPSSWTSSWAKSRVTTPGSGQISKVGGATNTHLDKIGM